MVELERNRILITNSYVMHEKVNAVSLIDAYLMGLCTTANCQNKHVNRSSKNVYSAASEINGKFNVCFRNCNDMINIEWADSYIQDQLVHRHIFREFIEHMCVGCHQHDATYLPTLRVTFNKDKKTNLSYRHVRS